MRLYYFFYSLFYFVRLIFTRKHYQVIFYSPHHFNRGESAENLFLLPMLQVCRQEKINFLYLEEPDIYSNQNRSKETVPFDFIYYLIIIFRKFMNSEMSYIERDKKIGIFFKKVFFRNITFDNYICISQSMLSFFRGMNTDARLFDLQHGTIHSKKESYLNDGKASSNLIENDTHLLLSGNNYKDLLVENEKGDYFANHSHVIGSSIFDNYLEKPVEINKNVLVSLQFTHDHTEKENEKIASKLELLIEKEKSFYFYLRNHPRFNNEIDLTRFTKLSNVELIDGDLLDNFRQCSLHLTVYSTTVFEAGLQGVPSYILQIDSGKMNIFNTQYHYPFYDLSLTEIHKNYFHSSDKVKKWAKQFYEPLNKDLFLKVLKNE